MRFVVHMHRVRITVPKFQSTLMDQQGHAPAYAGQSVAPTPESHPPHLSAFSPPTRGVGPAGLVPARI